MSAGNEYFPIKGLASIYMRKLDSSRVPTGNMIGIWAPQNFDVQPDQDTVEIPGGDAIAYEFPNFKKFDITVNSGAIKMEDLPLLMGGTYDGTDVNLATFEERNDIDPFEVELWVQSNTAAASGNTRYYEHYPLAKCLQFSNPRETGAAVQFAMQFSAFVLDSVKRTMFRDKTGAGIPGVVSADTTPPTVSSSLPAHNATGVSASVSPTVTWSEDMNPGDAVNLSLIRLSTGEAVAAEITYDGADPFVTTINPSSELTSAAVYYVKIPASTRDLNGNEKGTEQIIQFTIA